MKIKKRILSILLAVIIVAYILPMSAFAADAESTYSVQIFTTMDGFGTTTDIGGSINGAGDYKAGDTVTLTATPNSGYCAIGWVSSNNNVILTTDSQSTMTITFTMPAENVKITGSFHEHTLGVFYEDLANGTHDSYCFYCKEKENNPTDHIDQTDYTDEGEPDGRCDTCGADMHTHSYSSEWSSDEEGHWHYCECGITADFAEHTSSGAATEVKAEVCTVCGFEISPKLTHTHSYGTLKYNDNSHWYECSCGVISKKKIHSYNLKKTNNDETHTLTCECGLEIVEDCENRNANCEEPTEKCTVCGGYCAVQSIKHRGPFVDINTGNFYVSMEHAGYIDGLRCDSCKEYVSTPPPAIPVAIGSVNKQVDYINGTAYIVGHEDIANGSISDVDMTPIKGTATITNKQAAELIEAWLASYVAYIGIDEYKDYIRSQLKDYTLADLKVIRNNIERGLWPNDFIWDAVDKEIESKEATDLVIAQGYINSTSDFKVTTGQGLGVTYSNDALTALLTSVGTNSNVKVATKLEKAEITKDEAKTIVAEWAEIVNTAEGEEQIKNLLTNYSIYELALLHQATRIVELDNSSAQKIFKLISEERELKKEKAATKDNEEPLAKFSVNTYAVATDGTQTYIPISKSMQYTIPVDTSIIPENATLALYRYNGDGIRTKQQIISNENGLVIAMTDGNSDYILVYELAEEHTHSFEWVIDKPALWIVFSVVVLGIMAVIATVIIKKRKTIG